MSLLRDPPTPGCGTQGSARAPGRVRGTQGGVWVGPDVGFSLLLQAKRKLDLEGPEFCTPKGKGRTLTQVPSPRSKWCWARWGAGSWEGDRPHFSPQLALLQCPL